MNECCSIEVKSHRNAVTKPSSMKYYILPLSLSFYCTCSKIHHRKHAVQLLVPKQGLIKYHDGQLLALTHTKINALTSGTSQLSSHDSDSVKQIMNCHSKTSSHSDQALI